MVGIPNRVFLRLVTAVRTSKGINNLGIQKAKDEVQDRRTKLHEGWASDSRRCPKPVAEEPYSGRNHKRGRETRAIGVYPEEEGRP